MLENLDEKCGGTSLNLPEVSYFDGAFSVLLFITTVPANLLILLGLRKFSHLLNRNYYLVIANIALADLLMGLICDPMSISFHIKEALGAEKAPMKKMEQTAMHFLFFFFNTVSVLSMAVLTVDRLGVILNPFYYYGKLTKHRMVILLSITWILAAAITVIYVFIGYIRFLAVFAFTTVIMTLVVMLVTWVLLKKRLKEAKTIAERRNSHRSLPHLNSPVNARRRTNTVEFTQMDKKITKTFLFMLIIFVLNYLPCMVLIVYLNVCKDCDCNFVHILRDIVFLAILLSALCRALNFLVRLTALQESIKSLCQKTNGMDATDMPLNGVSKW